MIQARFEIETREDEGIGGTVTKTDELIDGALTTVLLESGITTWDVDAAMEPKVMIGGIPGVTVGLF